MRIAAVNWGLRDIASEKEFFDHLIELLNLGRGCDLIVLPEMFAIECLHFASNVERNDIPGFLHGACPDIAVALNDWAAAEARRGNKGIVLVGGSNLAKNQATGQYFNSCVMQPWKGQNASKVVLTEWEKEIGVSPGAGLPLFENQKIGVTICLDAEFPASGRALAEAGMLFQCVPAWTETMHGFQRVRWACQARAVENQVCVVHSSLVGKVGDLESHGSSAIIVPPHEPFPLNPILAETPMDEEGAAIAEVNPDDLLKCREQGEVRNWRDRDAGDWTVRRV